MNQLSFGIQMEIQVNLMPTTKHIKQVRKNQRDPLIFKLKIN